MLPAAGIDQALQLGEPRQVQLIGSLVGRSAAHAAPCPVGVAPRRPSGPRTPSPPAPSAPLPAPGSAGADGTGWLPLAWHAGDAADKGGVGETLLLGVLFAAWYGANIVFNMWVAARRWPRPGCSAAASC